MTKWIDKELLERRVILQQAAAKEHLPEYAVEKDWWVSMTLKALFKTSCKEHLEFKGTNNLRDVLLVPAGINMKAYL